MERKWTRTEISPLPGRPIVFGEVLFDCFPDGQTVLGGAPFNVAWHLQGFDCSPLMISSVGDDAHGEKVFTTMRKWGMETSGVQCNELKPTGQVTVQFEDGQPSYDIVTDQAYDHISAQDVLTVLAQQQTVQHPSLIYHGSLALREAHSRAALDSLLQKKPSASLETFVPPVFLDLNLRNPWWDRVLAEEFLQRATWVKLNDEELCEITSHPLTNGPELQTYAKALFESCQLERLIVTLGSQGAFVLSKEGIVEGQPVPAKNIVDTVGAGDAFSAVTIKGLLQGWSIQESLDRALAFASEVCQQRGATAQNSELYHA